LRLLFVEKPELLDTLIERIIRALVRSGALVDDPEQPWLDVAHSSV
tara:strand:+ start:77 stop:214 length:138 start_codon:yes stop_codon:yes gene_type:complete